MQIRKVLGGPVLAAGVGVAGPMGAGMVVADSSDGNGGTATGSNPSLSDTKGFGASNHNGS